MNANSQGDRRQPELGLFAVDPEDPNVGWLERWLEAKGGWVTAKQLCVTAGREEANGDRWVRALAAQSKWVISGQRGYKHLKHATAEEALHFVNWMESQGKKMFERAEWVRRNAHALVG